MWTSDDFPGADNVPWQFLIRARTQFEVDSIVASQIVRTVSGLASSVVAAEFAAAATRAVVYSRETQSANKPHDIRAAVIALDDYWDWCGTRWPRPFPPKRGFDFTDPLVISVADRAIDLLRTAGSPELQDALSKELGQLASGQ